MPVSEIVLRAILKMIAIWGSLLIIAIPLIKIGIYVAYEIWKGRKS